MENNRQENQQTDKQTLTTLMQGLIVQQKSLQCHNTARNYAAALRSFLRFREGKDLAMEEMGPDIILGYETYLKTVGVSRNTSSFYMRILRAVYNRAAKQGLTSQRHPFRPVYTGIDKTCKRAIPLGIIRKIKRLDLSRCASKELAKDAFLMSFYLRGISFIDLAHLRKSDIRDGFLHYNRRKTRQHIQVKWLPVMQEIVDKYQHLTATSDYLLPFLVSSDDRELEEEQAYHNAEARITYHLKRIGTRAGMRNNLTLYAARHSWATAARDRNVPVAVISEALGHHSETTTQIYLRSILTSEVDKANAALLAAL